MPSVNPTQAPGSSDATQTAGPIDQTTASVNPTQAPGSSDATQTAGPIDQTTASTGKSIIYFEDERNLLQYFTIKFCIN